MVFFMPSEPCELRIRVAKKKTFPEIPAGRIVPKTFPTSSSDKGEVGNLKGSNPPTTMYVQKSGEKTTWDGAKTL